MSKYNRIRDLREDENMTQKEAAEKFFMHLTQYRRYENGESEVPLSLAIKISEFYKVSLDYLAGLTNDKGGLHCNVLDQEEKKLLNDWKSLNSSDKKLIFYTIETLIEKSRKKEEKKSFG